MNTSLNSCFFRIKLRGLTLSWPAKELMVLQTACIYVESEEDNEDIRVFRNDDNIPVAWH